jgi:acyl carrier protein
MESIRCGKVEPRVGIDKQVFLADIEAMLELEPNSLKGPEALENHGWDSLSLISFQSLLDGVYGIRVDCARILECDTFDKLFSLVSESAGTVSCS